MRPRVADAVAVVAGVFDAQQRAVADAAGFARPGAARRMDADFRRLAVRLLVPFGRNGDQFAVAVALGDVGQDDLRQRAGLMQLLAAAFDAAFVGQFAQHPLSAARDRHS